MRAILGVAVVSLLLLLQLFTEGEASECCRPRPGYSNGQVTLNCGDCKAGTPYCGVGRCNIWGCNCDGGCRNGKCNGHYTAEQVMEEIDSDHDGKISLAEARHHLEKEGITGEHLDGAITLLGPEPEGHYQVEVLSADTKLDL